MEWCTYPHHWNSLCETLKCEACWFQFTTYYLLTIFTLGPPRWLSRQQHMVHILHLIPRTHTKMGEEKYDTNKFFLQLPYNFMVCIHTHIVHNNFYIFTLLFSSYLNCQNFNILVTRLYIIVIPNQFHFVSLSCILLSLSSAFICF